MELTLHAPEDALLVQSWRPGQVRIQDQIHHTPLLLLPHQVKPWEAGPPRDWPADQLAEIALPLLQHGAELWLIGTGEQPGLPEPRLLAWLAGQGLGCDFMPSRAACHTWNILQADGRRAVMLLLG